MKIWIIESGEYEQRGVDFAAESPEAALAHMKLTYPDKDWELTDLVRESAPGTPECRRFTPYRDIYIAPVGGKSYDSRYELLEVEFAGSMPRKKGEDQ